MPIYEYSCDHCGHQFEWLVRTTEEKPTCPSCSGKRLTRKLSLPVAHTRSAPACPIKEYTSGACGPQCDQQGCMFQ